MLRVGRDLWKGFFSLYYLLSGLFQRLKPGLFSLHTAINYVMCSSIDTYSSVYTSFASV